MTSDPAMPATEPMVATTKLPLLGSTAIRIKAAHCARMSRKNACPRLVQSDSRPQATPLGVLGGVSSRSRSHQLANAVAGRSCGHPPPA